MTELRVALYNFANAPNYIPETNYISRAYQVAAVLRLQFLVYLIPFLMLKVLYGYHHHHYHHHHC
jgi:uncharacterized membrane protein